MDRATTNESLDIPDGRRIDPNTGGSLDRPPREKPDRPEPATPGASLDVPDGGSMDPSGGSLDTTSVASASDDDRGGARDVPTTDEDGEKVGRAPAPDDRERQQQPEMDGEQSVPGVKEAKETLERTPGVPLG
jgi:hypothetical protein